MRSRLRACLLSTAVLAIACGDSTPPEPSPTATPTPVPTPTPEPPAPGTFVYLTNPDASTIAGFGVGGSTGALTPLSSSPTTLSGSPVALAIAAQARFAYVGLRGAPDALVTYAIDRQTGALAAVPGSGLAAPPITAELGRGVPQAAERLTLASLVLHPSCRFAYATFDYTCYDCICGVEAWLYVYGVDSSTGILTKLDLPDPTSTRRAAG
jgi:hypothetical protein